MGAINMLILPLTLLEIVSFISGTYKAAVKYSQDCSPIISVV